MGRYSDGSIYDSAENSGYSGSGSERSYARFHGQGDDEEDEALQRQIALMEAQGREKRSYALFDQDIKSAETSRNMRQGIYSSPEQMAMDEFGPMYQSTPDSAGQGIDISMSGGMGPEQAMEGPEAPMFRRTMVPDAQKKMDLFRKSGGQNGIPIDEFKERERFKAEQKLLVADQLNKLRMDSERAGQPFDAARAKAQILSRNPGGVDPTVVDELLSPYINQRPVAAPVSTQAPQESPQVSVSPMGKKLKVKVNGQVVEMTEQELAQLRAQRAKGA